MAILTPEMIASRALAHFAVEVDFLKGIPRHAWPEPKPDTRTKWQKTKDRMNSRVNRLRHRVACLITPYGFDE